MSRRYNAAGIDRWTLNAVVPEPIIKRLDRLAVLNAESRSHFVRLGLALALPELERMYGREGAQEPELSLRTEDSLQG